MEALAMRNVECARERLLTTERHLQRIVDQFCSHELSSSEATPSIVPFLQDIDRALCEIRAAQAVLDTALISAGLTFTDSISRG